jgi:hypothetical protein
MSGKFVVEVLDNDTGRAVTLTAESVAALGRKLSERVFGLSGDAALKALRYRRDVLCPTPSISGRRFRKD